MRACGAEFVAFGVNGSLNIMGTAEPQPGPQGEPRVFVTFEAFELQWGSALRLRVPLSWVRPTGWVQTTYLDDSFRVGRGDKGSIFVTARTNKPN